MAVLTGPPLWPRERKALEDWLRERERWGRVFWGRAPEHVDNAQVSGSVSGVPKRDRISTDGDCRGTSLRLSETFLKEVGKVANAAGRRYTQTDVLSLLLDLGWAVRDGAPHRFLAALRNDDLPLPTVSTLETGAATRDPLTGEAGYEEWVIRSAWTHPDDTEG